MASPIVEYRLKNMGNGGNSICVVLPATPFFPELWLNLYSLQFEPFNAGAYYNSTKEPITGYLRSVRSQYVPIKTGQIVTYGFPNSETVGRLLCLDVSEDFFLTDSGWIPRYFVQKSASDDNGLDFLNDAIEKVWGSLPNVPAGTVYFFSGGSTMMRKMFYGMASMATLSMLMWLTPVGDYSKLAWRKATGWTSNAVPVSWDLETAKDAVKGLGSEIKEQKGKVARAEVDAERSALELERVERRVEDQKSGVIAMREMITPDKEFVNVAFNNGTEVELGIGEAKSMLAAEFENLRTNLETVENMRKNVATKRLRVVQANRSLDAAIAQKRQMEAEIESLETKMNVVSSDGLGIPMIDTTSFAKCRALLDSVDEKIRVHEKIAGGAMSITSFKSPKASQDITTAIDDFFNPSGVAAK